MGFISKKTRLKIIYNTHVSYEEIISVCYDIICVIINIKRKKTRILISNCLTDIQHLKICRTSEVSFFEIRESSKIVNFKISISIAVHTSFAFNQF